MNHQKRSSFLAAVLLIGGLPAFAASFIVPPDRELVQAAHAIVIGTVEVRFVEPTADGGIQTHYDLSIERVFKGRIETGEPLRITEAGGSFGNRALKIQGTPEYVPGERVLVFLQQREDQSWRTWGKILGKFNFVRDAIGAEFLVRGATGEEVFGWDYEWKRHEERPRASAPFLTFIESIVCGIQDSSDYSASPQLRRSVIHSANHGFSALDYEALYNFGNLGTFGARWVQMLAGGSVTFRTKGSQGTGLDSTGAVDRAMAAWNGEPNSSIALVRGGTDGTRYNTFSEDGDDINSIEFAATNSDLGGGNQVGVTSVRVRISQPLPADKHAEITESDIAIAASATFTQQLLDEVVAHELGHSLNFRHSNESPDTTSVAVMNFKSFASFGANLQPWDQRAAAHVYGSGGSTPPPCTAASIGSASASPSTIAPGQSATLSVVVGGTAPVTVQWFTSGNVLVGTGTSISVSPSVTTSFFARATNSCNSSGAQSNTVTVTVNAPTCTAAAIGSASASPSAIEPGASSTLSVTASGTAPVTVQWFTTGGGFAGNGTSITVAPSVTTSYFARATNSCNSTGAQSNTVTVTVNVPVCTAASIGAASANPATIQPGSSATLSVSAAGTAPLTIQWFTTGGAFAGTGTSISVNPSVTTSYFARASNNCTPNPAQSNTVTVTVTSVCVAPVITSQPTGATITAGQQTTLSVDATGSQNSFQWFRDGVALSGQTQSSISVTTAGSYRVNVSGCGTTVSSNSAVVNVVAACMPAAITQQPAGSTIVSGKSVTLSVGATGTALSFSWFQNGVSIPGATGPSVTVSPTVTSQYFARITNSCSSVLTSNTVTVNVTPAGSARKRSTRR
ncbi:MAG TPA: hypothetical protein VNM92_09700 [Thermoanaerobaculia bacterium]|nr:hypothetical protein [Thermoanaerobaculia bacterium]